MSETGDTKGERTRARLFDAAVQRFQLDGYEGASMRRIAADAGVTPGLLYRYFDSKAAIVEELYGEALRSWQDRAEAMPSGTWMERTLWLTRAAFEALGPYRDLLKVLAGSMLAGDPTTSPLRNEASRRAASPVFDRAVREATDAPRRAKAGSYSEFAYLTHLALILFWVTDDSPAQTSTETLLEQTAGLTPFLNMGLKTPVVGGRILGVVETISASLRGGGAS